VWRSSKRGDGSEDQRPQTAPKTKDHKRLQRPETTNGSEDQRPQTAPEATGDPHTAGRGCAVSRENSTRGQGAGGGRDPEAVASSAAVRPWWLRRRVRSVRAEGRGVSGQYVRRDEACPVSTCGGTRRVRSVRAEGRGVSGQYVRRDEACPVSTCGGTRRVRSVRAEGRGVSGQYVRRDAGDAWWLGRRASAPKRRRSSATPGWFASAATCSPGVCAACPISTGRRTRRVRLEPRRGVVCVCVCVWACV
jgi:hypothetical protein